MQKSAAKGFFDNMTMKHHGVEQSGDGLRHLLNFYQHSLSNSEKAILNESLEKMPLYCDIVTSAADHFPKNAQQKNGIMQLVGIIGKLYGWSRSSDVSLDRWAEIKSSLIVDGIFSSEISTKHANSLRHLGNVLAKMNIDSGYKLVSISDPRRLGPNGEKKSRHASGMHQFFDRHPEYKKWNDAWNSYKEQRHLKSFKNQDAAFNKFVRFNQEVVGMQDQIVFFSEQRPDFFDWLKNNVEGPIVTYAKELQHFSNWFVDQYLVDYDEDENERVFLGHPLFSDQRLNNITQEKNPSVLRNSETPKLPMPTKYVSLCKEILTEEDYAFSKSLEDEYFEKEGERIWCPCNTISFLILLELPARRGQMKLVDSGEGDELYFDHTREKWVENPSVHAGYWKKIGAKVPSRGLISPSKTAPDKVDLYLTTNKTKDIAVGFGEESGQWIPWHNETIISLCNEMREWQEKHNPVAKPKKAITCPASTWASRPSKSVLEATPDRFYLFRSPLNKSDPEAPPPDYKQLKFWYRLMLELQNRLNAMGDDTQIVTSYNVYKKSAEPNGAIFVPHGLRVTGLTALMGAGVPLEVLSKIVAGHSAILMTLHYIKFNNTHITDVLNKAKVDIEASEQHNYRQWLREASWTDARKYSVFNSEETYSHRWNSGQIDSSLFENRQIGICPNSGTLCNSGGEVVRKDRGKTINGPVPGGPGNCHMCRYLITGKPWLIPLWLMTNEKFLNAKGLSEKVEIHRVQLERLLKERYQIAMDAGVAGVPFSLQTEISQTEAALDKASARLDQMLNEAHRAYILTEAVRNVGADELSNLPMPLEDEDDGGFIFQETSSFKQQDFLVQASRLYPLLEVEDAEKDRAHFIDTVLFNSGITPIGLSGLSDTEKREAADAAAKYLVTHLSDRELAMLEIKAVTLAELGYTPQVRACLNEYIDNGSQASLIPLVDVEQKEDEEK